MAFGDAIKQQSRPVVETPQRQKLSVTLDKELVYRLQIEVSERKKANQGFSRSDLIGEILADYFGGKE